MSVAEMKKKILEKIDSLSETQLAEITQIIEEINNPKHKEYNLMEHVESIVSEREEVLKKLAK